MTNIVDWDKLHNLNQIWRLWMDAHSPFATPQTLDSLRYAAGETREARIELSAITAELLLRYIADVAPVNTLEILRILDAHAHEARDLWMRGRLPEHARNHVRAGKIREELAQVVMLLLTALPEIRADIADMVDDNPTMDDICDYANAAVMYHDDDVVLEQAHWMSQQLLYMIAKYPGVNIEADLRQCWWQLLWKHASQYVDDYPNELRP